MKYILVVVFLMSDGGMREMSSRQTFANIEDCVSAARAVPANPMPVGAERPILWQCVEYATPV